MSDASAAKQSGPKNIDDAREKLADAQEKKLELTATRRAPDASVSIRSSGLKGLRITSAAANTATPPATKNPEVDDARSMRRTPGMASEKPKAPAMTERKAPLADIAPSPKEATVVSYEQEAEPTLILTPSNARPMAKPTKYKLINVTGVLLTALWIGLCFGYVQSYVGWSELLQLQPHLLGGFLAGALAPLALLWMVLAYLQRGADIHMYADALRAELQAMIFPTEERAQVISKDIEQLCHQAAELSTASKAVLKSIHRARLGLRSEINDLTGISKKTEFHIDRLAEGLHERSAKLLSLTEEIEGRTKSIDLKSKDGVDAWDEVAKIVLQRAAEIEASMGRGADKLDAAAEKMKETARVGDLLDQQVKALETVTDKATGAIREAGDKIRETRDSLDQGGETLAARVGTMATSLKESVSAIQDAVESATEKTASLEERIEARAASLKEAADGLGDKVSAIETIGTEAANKLTEAMTVAVSSAETIGGAARRAVESLTRSAFDTRKQAEDILSGAKDNIERLEISSRTHIEQVRGLIGSLEKGRIEVEQATDLAEKRAAALNDAAETRVEKLKVAQEQLAERVESIAGAMDAPVLSLERAVDKLNVSHQQVGETLTNRVADLTDATQKAQDRAEAIRDSLRAQTQEVSTLAGQLAGHSRSISDTLERQKEEITDRVKVSLEQIEKVRSALASESQILLGVAQTAQERLDALQISLSESCGEIQNSTGKTLSDLSSLDEKLSEQVASLQAKTQNAANSVRSVTEALEVTASGYEPLFSNAMDRIETATDKMQELRSGFEESSDSNLEKLKRIGMVFDERLKSLKDGADEASRILTTSGDYLRERMDDIEVASRTASERMETIGSTLEHQSSDIHIAADQAIMKIEAIRKKIDDQFIDLTTTVGEALIQLQNAGNEFDARAARVRDASEESTALIAKTGEKAVEQSGTLKDNTLKTVAATRDLVQQVQKEADTLLSASQATLLELKKAGDGFALRAREVGEHMKASLQTSKTYGQELGQQAESIADLSAKSADRISGAITALNNRMSEIGDQTRLTTAQIEKVKGKLAEEGQSLLSISAKAIQAADDVSTNFHRQSGSLFKAAQDAVAQAEKMRGEQGRAQRENFFSAAKFVIESLHSLSVDITRLMEGDIPEKTWKAYQKGDIGAFTRRLAELRDTIPAEKVQSKYEKDGEFRSYVNRFVRHYEEVFDQALATDHGDLLAATFATSDMGKLYEALCIGAGKEPKQPKSALRKAA